MNRSSHHVHHQIAIILEDPNNHQSEIIILFNIFDGIPSFLFLERPFSSEARRKVATPSARPGWCAYGDQQDRGLTMGLAINLVILPKKEREFIGLTMSKHHCHQYSAWYEESESEIFFQRERGVTQVKLRSSSRIFHFHGTVGAQGRRWDINSPSPAMDHGLVDDGFKWHVICQPSDFRPEALGP